MMNKYEKEVEIAKLKAEKQELNHLKAIYNKATKDIANKIEISNGKINVLLKNFDELDDVQRSILQSQIYQRNFQLSLKKQIDDFLSVLQTEQYKSVDEYLKKCYETGYIGSMYSIHGQGIPLIMPIDQKKVTKAMVHDTKLSKKLYTKLGEDVNLLKKRIANNISRGIATADSYANIARNIANGTNVGINKTMRIARTEGHRIQSAAAFDAQHEAKAAGADVVKMWSAALDGRTRETHRELDGQIREIDEPFEVGGMSAMYPSDFGDPAEDINCRCALLQRAKWALDEDELQTLQERAAYFGLDKTKDFNDFKGKYLKAAEEASTAKPAQTRTFTPAKTIEEAEEFAKQFVDTSSFGSVGMSYKGVNIQVANEINKALDNFFNQFNVGKLGGIAAPAKNTKLGKMITAHAGYMPVRNSLLLNRDQTKNLKIFTKALLEDKDAVADFLKHPERYNLNNMSSRIVNVLKNSKISGRGLVTENVEECINHELGHFLEQYLKNDIKIIEEGMEKYAPKISGYATESMGEYIAESFASYMRGENIIDPKLKELFEGLRK
ncbi:MAG: phage minor head protein [Agathobacter sp.]